MSKNMIMLWTLGYWALGWLHDQLIVSIGMSASAVNFLETAFDTVALALVAWILNRSDVRSEFIRIWTTPKEVSKLIVATVLISVKSFSTKYLLVDRGPWVTELAKGTVVILVLCVYPYRKNLPYWAAISSCLIVFGLLLMEDGKKLNLTFWIITIGLLDVGSAHYSARIHKSSLITMLAQAPVQLLTSLAIWWFSGFSMAKNSDESIALWKVGFLVCWALVFHYFAITIIKWKPEVRERAKQASRLMNISCDFFINSKMGGHQVGLILSYVITVTALKYVEPIPPAEEEPKKELSEGA